MERDAGTTFACLACSGPADPALFYCGSCREVGRLMRHVQQRVVDLDARPLVHVTCPGCHEQSPAYGDVDSAACLHCFELLRVADCLTA
jgi:hypothetical protein